VADGEYLSVAHGLHQRAGVFKVQRRPGNGFAPGGLDEVVARDAVAGERLFYGGGQFFFPVEAEDLHGQQRVIGQEVAVRPDDLRLLQQAEGRVVLAAQEGQPLFNGGVQPGDGRRRRRGRCGRQGGAGAAGQKYGKT
jgi:hypothetical protein